MKKMKLGILVFVAVLALVAVASAIPATITVENRAIPGPNSYVVMDTTNGDFDLPIGTYDGWCAGKGIAGLTGYTYLTADSRNDLSGLPLWISSTQWNKVNWILNNPAADWRINQAAIWKVDGGSSEQYPSAKWVRPDTVEVGGYSHTAFDTYMLSVNAHGTYVPTEVGDKYGVILYKLKADQRSPDGQPLLIPATIPEIPSPEFPTIALPVGMIISMVGIVYTLRTKKE